MQSCNSTTSAARAVFGRVTVAGRSGVVFDVPGATAENDPTREHALTVNASTSHVTASSLTIGGAATFTADRAAVSLPLQIARAAGDVSVYVSPGGTDVLFDTAFAGSVTAPLATVGTALNVPVTLPDGTPANPAILLAPGEYAIPDTITCGGFSIAGPPTLAAVPPAAAIGVGAVISTAVNISVATSPTPRYDITFSNIRFSGGTVTVTTPGGSAPPYSIAFTNCIFDGPLAISSAAGTTVAATDCYFADTISVISGPALSLQRCTLTNPTSPCIAVLGGAGLSAADTTFTSLSQSATAVPPITATSVPSQFTRCTFAYSYNVSRTGGLIAGVYSDPGAGSPVSCVSCAFQMPGTGISDPVVLASSSTLTTYGCTTFPGTAQLFQCGTVTQLVAPS